MRQVPKITKTFVNVVLFICLISFFPFSVISQPPPPNASLYHYGNIDVLNLHGSYLEMGEQYGQFEHTKLQFFYHKLYDLLILKSHLSYDHLYQTIALKLYHEYPMRFRNIITGMSKTSGLTLKQEIFVNAFEYMLWQIKHKNVSLPGCDFISTNGAYTHDKSMIIGRNYDYFTALNDIRALLTVAIFHPNSGDNTVALITYVGTLNATTLYNNQGIFLELNTGYPSGILLQDHDRTHWDRLYTTIDLLAMMFDAPNMANLQKQLMSYRSNADFIINIANAKYAVSYEWTSNKIKKAQTSQKSGGIVVATNHFVDPSWSIKQTTNLFGTRTRRQHLLQQAKRYKGKIDVSMMQQILATKTQKGGAMDLDTVFQVINTPQNGLFWLRIPGVQNHWAKIDLKSFMTGA